MPRPLEEVFKTSGIPTFTFVRPLEYPALIVALRTPGRGVVIEGPSGIGKTTAVTRALEELGFSGRVTKLSARRPDDVRLIRELASIPGIGTVLIDDFHKLDAGLRSSIADLMKVFADEERVEDKVIVLGINKAGESLVRFAYDLNNRLEVIPFEANPSEKVEELISLGEDALNIDLNIKTEVRDAAHGSFYVAQMLSHQACLDAGILQEQVARSETSVSFAAIRGKVFDRLSRSFMERTKRFARGTRFRREGRAPYLHLLHWLATSEEWSLVIDQAVRSNPALAGSISQIVEKGYLRDLISDDVEIGAALHFDSESHVLTVEDPQYIYFLRNIPWSQFPEEVGFLSIEFPSRYDFALSFAGSDRDVAHALDAALQDMEFEVFYDHNEQHRMLAEDIEDYLRPIYQSDAEFVIALLGPDFPKRIWTKFESDQFKSRFKSRAVIPVWFANAPPGIFDESTRLGGITFDRSGNFKSQIQSIADLLCKKLGDKRSKGEGS
jgi:hypothetical protein